jgi:3-deoxy-D-manno-octulosonic-acid transferase
MELWYKSLTYLFYPFSRIYLFLRKLNKKEHPTRFKEKLSKISIARGEGFLIWLHAVSVGEVMSILPLIENFEKNIKISKILITTTTLSSAGLIEKKLIKYKKTVHQFLPLDITIYVQKFLDHWKPNLSIFVDSEIWPNTIFKIKEKKIPLLLINARITKKTFYRWKLFKKFSQSIFEKFDLCLVANNETEGYLKFLGAKNIKSCGNLKFSDIENQSEYDLKTDILEKIHDRKIWCAASTHPNEEIFCAKTHLLIKKKINNILTIIVPRHIERAKKISIELSKLNIKTVLYSNYKELNNDTDILLIDSYGELKKIYNISKNVFLGKSLTNALAKDSGQNPIEASRLGCKIFHGPFVSNFVEIYDFLKLLKVTQLINTPSELSKFLLSELNIVKENNNNVKQKIDKYGIDILNNVIKEIKIYINN